MQDPNCSVVQGTPQAQSARKENPRVTSALNARSTRSVIFSPNNTSHPYSPAQRPSLSIHPRSALSRSKSGLQSPVLTPTKGILKRTNSDDIRLAKDVIEGTRVNGRSFKRAQPGSSLANGGEVPSSSSPPSSVHGGEQEIAMSSSPPPATSSPSSTAATDTVSVLASINTHIQTLLSASTPTYPYDPTRRTAAPTPSPSPQGYHFQTSASDVAEAYTALTTRFRSFFLNPEAASEGPTVELHGPLRANAPDLIRAFTRDLSRLFTQPDVGDENRGSSPSMMNGESGSSGAAEGERRIRRGFSDEEITMRREEVAAGHAVLKWLALVFHVPEIFESFSDADILALLRILLKIPLSPQTPSATTPFFTATSASKRTYAFSIYALTHLRLPNRILLPVANDIIEACRRATTLNFPTASAKVSAAGPVPGTESTSNIKAKVEGLGAIYNLLSRNSSIFLSYHKELIPILLRGLIDKTPSVRARASAALGAAIAGGRGWVAECEEALRLAVERDAFGKTPSGRVSISKVEKERRKVERKKREDDLRRSRKVSEEEVALTVVNGLKKKVGSGKDEMRTVQAIVVQLKTSLEKESAQWAVATWAILITLLGRNVATHITDLLDFMNVARNAKNSRALTLLCRQAWDHVIHAFVSQSSRRLSATDSSVDPSSDSFSYNLDWCLTPKRTKLLVTFVTTAKDAPPQLVEVTNDSGVVTDRRWKERDPLGSPAGQKTEMLRISVKSLTSLVYALTGALLETAVAASPPLPASAQQNQQAGAIKPAKCDLPAITVTTTSSTGNVLVPATSSATTETPSSAHDSPTAEQIKLDHLTTLFEGVVQPLLTPILAIAALDDVKLLGWKLLTAIFVPTPNPGPSEPFKLDRLLCQPFLRGEIGSFSSPDLQSPTPAIREQALWDLATSAARDAVEIDEVRSWPVEWTSSRFSISVVKIFEAAIRGMRGLSEPDHIEWVRSVEGIRLLPVELSNLWKGMLEALNSIKPADATRPSKNYLLGLVEVTRLMNTILLESPATYLPPTFEFKCDLELVKYGLVEHLLSVVLAVVGSDALSAVIPVRDDSILGAGRNGYPSAACILITRLVGRKIPTAEDDSSARFAFAGLLEKLVDAGVQGELGLKLLGDLTTNLENLASDEGNDHLRLDLWRIISRKWTAHWPKEADPSSIDAEEEEDLAPDASPAASFIPKSTTLDLLTDLLTDPFRRFPTAWATASSENVTVWRGLLETTIGRCKAKKMSGNIAVVESIAASLTDFEVAESLSRPALGCLAAMADAVRYPGVNYPTNNAGLALKLVMRDLPESFLILIAQALCQAYSTVPSSPDQVAPTAELFKSCARLLQEIPIGFVPRATELLAGPVELWLEDAERVASPGVHANGPVFLYETILSLLASTSYTREGHVYRVVQPTNVELRKLTPLLLCAATARHSLRAIDALESFWNATFAGAKGLDPPIALKEVLKGLRKEGVDVAASMSQSQSQSQAASLLPDPFTLPYHVPSSPVETQPEDSRDVHEESYDADRSSAATQAESTLATNTQASASEAIVVDDSSEEEDHRPPQTRSKTSTPAKDAPVSPVRQAAASKASASPSGNKRRRQDQAHTPSKRRHISPEVDEVRPISRIDGHEAQEMEEEVLMIEEGSSDREESPGSDGPPPGASRRPTQDHDEEEFIPANKPRTLRRSNSSSSVLATAVSWLPRMFRSPGPRNATIDPDATVDDEQVAEQDRSGESLPVTEQERARKRVKIALDDDEEESFGGDEILEFDEEEKMAVEEDDKSVTGLTHMSPSSQGSSSVVRETPKSARRAHRQTERKRMFGTESLINLSISFSLPADDDQRIFSHDVHSDPSQVPGSASSGHGSLSLRAEPAILEDEPEPADDTVMTENLSPLAKRSLAHTAVSALRYPHVAAPPPPPAAGPVSPPAADAVPPAFESLMSYMQDHIDGNDLTPQELARHSARLAGMLAEMQNQLAAKLTIS